MTDHTWAILGVVGTTVFGLLSIILYRRSRQLRRLDALWSVSTLQSKKHQDVRILFKDQEIDDLSRLRILFVNSGTLAIRPDSDFPSQFGGAVKLRRAGELTRFLSAAALVGDVGMCRAKVLVTDDRGAAMTFEYMNPGQRIGIEVLYTGPAPEVAGELIGGGLRLKRSSGEHWIDGLAEGLLPVLWAGGVMLSAGWLFRIVRGAGLPFGTFVAAAGSIAFVVATVFVSVRYIVRAWARYRLGARSRLCLDFLAGRERPNQALHPTAASVAQ